MTNTEKRLSARLANFVGASARHVSKQLSEQLAKGTWGKEANARIRRDAFLYLDPTGDDFAQCGTCALFRPGEQTCAVVVGHIVAEGSCGLYAHGEADDDQDQRAEVSQEAAGYVVRPVRCENCRFFRPDVGRCHLYYRLNEALPYVFDLEEGVSARGCCNAQTPMTEERVEKSSDHPGGIDLHVKPENAQPVHGIPVADAVTSANVQHVSWEMVREGKTKTRLVQLPLDSLIATQRVVDRERVGKHERELRQSGQTESGAAPLVIKWDGDYFILGGHHGLQAAYNLQVPLVEVDLMMAPE